MNLKNLKAVPSALIPPNARVEPTIEEEIRTLIPAEFVPPKDRTEQIGRLTLNAVDSFAELPTKELDSLIEGVEAKLAEIKKKANAIKADYMERTTELKAAVARLNEACCKGEAKMEELHVQLNEIYAKRPSAAVTHTTTEGITGASSEPKA